MGRTWNRYGGAGNDRNSRTSRYVRPIDVVVIQASWEKEGGGGCKIRPPARIEKRRKGQNSKKRGAGGVGCLVKAYLWDMIEVTEDRKFDESIRLKMIPGERRAKYYFSRSIYMPPESKSTVKNKQEKNRRRGGRCA